MDVNYIKTNENLSIIIRVVGGELFLRRCLNHLVPQAKEIKAEVIVPFVSSSGEFRSIQSEFPDVVFIEIMDTSLLTNHKEHPVNAGTRHSMYDRLTAAGLRHANGTILALLEDYDIPAPDWCAQVMKAHQLPHAAIGGAVEHSGTGWLNWAVYFLDFGRYQLPLLEGPSHYLTDVNISYKRDDLDKISNLWKNEYNEVIINWALSNSKQSLWLRPSIVVYQDRGDLNFWNSLVERYHWGMIFSQKRSTQIDTKKRIIYIIACPFLPLLFLVRLARKVFSGHRNLGKFVVSSPLIVLLGYAWSLGELAGLLRIEAL
jgi:hypothetical protein